MIRAGKQRSTGDGLGAFLRAAGLGNIVDRLALRRTNQQFVWSAAMSISGMHRITLASWAAFTIMLAAPFGALAATPCPVSHEQLTAALKGSVKPSGGPTNGGLDNNEWAAVVNRNGIVCAVTFSGGKPDDQWPGSRSIAAEKANTVNGLSLKTSALSTANLYAGAQPGGYLYGLPFSDPVATNVIDAGPPTKFGSGDDPMLGKTAGGIIVFGGGLALYTASDVVGGLGVSGDTSCADHNVAWRVRHKLGLDKVPAGVGPNRNDGIIYDIGPNGKSASGYGHPACGGKEGEIANQIGSGSGVGGK